MYKALLHTIPYIIVLITPMDYLSNISLYQVNFLEIVNYKKVLNISKIIYTD